MFFLFVGGIVNEFLSCTNRFEYSFFVRFAKSLLRRRGRLNFIEWLLLTWQVRFPWGIPRLKIVAEKLLFVGWGGLLKIVSFWLFHRSQRVHFSLESVLQIVKLWGENVWHPKFNTRNISFYLINISFGYVWRIVKNLFSEF